MMNGFQGSRGRSPISGLLWLLLSGCGASPDETVASVSAAAESDPGVVPVSLALGAVHSCALMSDGSVRCWGRGEFGSLGDGALVNSDAPVVVSGLSDVVSISSGFSHSCAVLEDGSAWCWGPNSFGELGDGTTTDAATPVEVQYFSNIVEISGGTNHTCARLGDGSVWCWGNIPDGTAEIPVGPVQVPDLGDVVALEAGHGLACALIADGSVKCWGTPFGSSVAIPPTTVAGLSGVISLSVGLYHACAVVADGSVECWGDNSQGQLGRNYLHVTSSSQPSPALGILTPATLVSAGVSHTCTVVGQGGVRCFGNGLHGALGNGQASGIWGAERVTKLINVHELDAGMHHSCAITQTGVAVCWGDSYYGQLGNPAPGSTTPVKVLGL